MVNQSRGLSYTTGSLVVLNNIKFSKIIKSEGNRLDS